ncbi:MAG: hypothetical protein ACJASM_003159, partial [Salibacteraceae bacterium]
GSRVRVPSGPPTRKSKVKVYMAVDLETPKEYQIL